SLVTEPCARHAPRSERFGTRLVAAQTRRKVLPRGNGPAIDLGRSLCMLASSRSVLCDRYELGPVIGRGGMAEVRTAHDRRLRRTVAVKCFDPAAWATAQGRARFEVEARAGAAVSHPNVVIVHDVGVDDGMPFIVMECLPGRTFADELQRGAAPIARVLDVMRALLDAVAV